MEFDKLCDIYMPKAMNAPKEITFINNLEITKDGNYLDIKFNGGNIWWLHDDEHMKNMLNEYLENGGEVTWDKLTTKKLAEIGLDNELESCFNMFYYGTNRYDHISREDFSLIAGVIEEEITDYLKENHIWNKTIQKNMEEEF